MAQPVTIPFEQLQNTIRERLKARGAHGIRGLGRAFRNMDDNGNRMLDKYEFSKALVEMGLNLNKMEFVEVMRYYDKNGDGNISFDEFLLAVRDPLNERRLNLVKKAFKILDRDGSGELTLADIMGRYDAKKHPKVLAGEMTEQQALQELLDAFEGDHLGPDNDPTKHDQKVTIDEFIQYYTAVSSSIDEDDYFALMMTSAWKMTE